ncbi:hypothetical protein F751_5310 [Auxenochlorella protothecoides]|uniref:Uncharacterized protein n=1 Tax=Auxenochlorella protothecoides TaxID=3075 RepID=A0A087SRP3_AUXPR|nr:hypothetical protein F751_5310 [Auxenochlorella protothecoides]KFM28397.1 hypothetical protein F751_5310 [Auxenochlorella protothecoides]
MGELRPSVLSVQQDRAAVYNDLKQAFLCFIKTRAEGPWRHAMAAAAPAFQALSDKIRSLIASCPAHAPLLSRLQDLERERLRMTLALYALQAPARLELFAWQQNDGSPLKAGQGCGCGSGDGHSRAAHQTQEPTEAEFRAAVRELTCGIEENTVAINDVLDEVRDIEDNDGSEDMSEARNGAPCDPSDAHTARTATQG